MDEQNLEQLRDTLAKLTKLEDALKKEKTFSDELMDLRMLVEFIKEQIPYEDTAHPIGSIR